MNEDVLGILLALGALMISMSVVALLCVLGKVLGRASCRTMDRIVNVTCPPTGNSAQLNAYDYNRPRNPNGPCTPQDIV